MIIHGHKMIVLEQIATVCILNGLIVRKKYKPAC